MIQRYAKKIKRFYFGVFRYYLKSQGKKPLVRQLREMAVLYRTYHYPPYQYIIHGLFLARTGHDYMAYLPPKQISQFRGRQNSPRYHYLVIDKSLFAKVMQKAGLNVVNNLYTIRNDRSLVDRQDNPVTYMEMMSALAKDGHNTVFIKPRFGGSGACTAKLTFKEGALFYNGCRLDVTKFFNLPILFKKGFETYIMQPYIQQHRLLNSINPSSVNTVRMDTILTDSGVEINTAALRVGNGFTSNDNWGDGGYLVGIDLHTGRLCPTGKTTPEFGGIEVREHPVTGFRFADTQIPFWDEINNAVKRGAVALSPLMCVGWDIAITESGPLIVEANQDYAIDLAQEACGGLLNSPLGRAYLREGVNVGADHRHDVVR